MNLHEDSSLVNLAVSRTVIEKISNKDWNSKNDSLKTVYRDSIRSMLCLDTAQKILITSGKKFFYDFDKASVNFHKGINCFISNGVDPWYAQAILLIESPNKLQKSNAGAYGSFQLMKDVARMYGLKVNRQVDERADFERSAYAASSLIKKICIPYTKKMLDSLKIVNYNEHDLWFRLLVMHSYHAGAYNVQKALFACNPCEGNMELVYSLWRTQTKRFKSASQNYSQLILAAMFEMDARRNELQLAKL
jgi:Transglycosylase SLT domain